MNLDMDGERLRRYLLGELPEEESAALEERYFGADDVFAAVLAAEDDLAEEYLRGRLSSTDRERFERRFLSTTDGRRRLGIVREMTNRRAARSRPRRVGAGRSLRPFGRLAAAAAVLAALAAGWSLMRGGHRHPPAVAELGPRPGPPASPPGGATSPPPESTPAPPRLAPAEAVLSVTLAAGLVREPGASAAFEIPRDTKTLLLVLLLPHDDYPRYRVSIQTPEGHERSSQEALMAHREKAGAAVEVRVATSLLAPGTYVAIVSGLSGYGRAEAAGEYVFRVKRPVRSAAPSPSTYLAPPDHMWAEHDFSERG